MVQIYYKVRLIKHKPLNFFIISFAAVEDEDPKDLYFINCVSLFFGYLGEGFNQLFYDYNGHTYWFSAGVSRLIKNNIIQEWVNFAIGFSLLLPILQTKSIAFLI